MDIEAIVGYIALAVGIACAAAGVYIWFIYRQRYEEGALLRRIFIRNMRVSAASAVLAFFIAYAYLAEPLPRPWGAVIIGCCLVAYEWGPIADALLIFRERRKPLKGKA